MRCEFNDFYRQRLIKMILQSYQYPEQWSFRYKKGAAITYNSVQPINYLKRSNLFQM